MPSLPKPPLIGITVIKSKSYIKNAKTCCSIYFAEYLHKTRKNWSYIKTINGGSKISSPTSIIEAGKNITGNTIIAKMMNAFFVI